MTSADILGQATTAPLDQFTTLSLTFASDDFNHPNLDPTLWTLVDPLGGGGLRLEGSGTSDAQLVLTAPGGGDEYLPFSVNDSVRVMQPSADTDFELEVKFEMDLDEALQIVGVAIEETPDTWVRFDFYFDGDDIRAFSAGFTQSSVEVTSDSFVLSGPLSASTPIFMRVRRTGDVFTQEFSLDGASWTALNSFTHALNVQSVGVFAGNAGSNPPLTEAVVDYFTQTGFDLNDDTGVPTDVTEPFIYRFEGTPLNDSSVQLGWASDEPTSVVLEYGLTPAFELGIFDTYAPAFERDVVVSGLLSSTPYFFRVTAADSPGNEALAGPVSATPFPAGFTGLPQFTVFYGQLNAAGEIVQRFGHLGEPQNWVNILGNVQDLGGSVASLTYTLNGGPSLPLSIGLNRFPLRLSQDGDFNIEIDRVQLNAGLNDVVLTATDNEGNQSSQLIRIDFTPGVSWPTSYGVDWSTATDIQDVAQVVDGRWAIEDDPEFPGEKVVRTAELGYDRVLAFGDIQWENYEVEFQMRANALDPDGFTESSNSHAFGIILRWVGHFAIGAQRPRVGFFPFGSVTTYRWFPTFERWDHYGTNFSPRGFRTENPIQLGVTYMARARVETQADGSRRYQFRVWERGGVEPTTWLYDITHPAGSGLDSGSMLLFSNHVDASFGNFIVTPLPGN